MDPAEPFIGAPVEPPAMAATWTDRTEDLLYDGESVRERVPVGTARLVVTSHRLLAFTPDDEPRFRQVDRPNVTGVAVETSARTDLLRTAARPALWGLVLLVGGLLISFDSLLGPVSTPSGVGVGGILSIVQTITTGLSLLDDAMRVLGSLLLLVALVPVLGWLRSRERQLVVAVSGGDDVRVAVDGEDPESVAAALTAALRPD